MRNQELQDELIDEMDTIVQTLHEFHPDLVILRHFVDASLDVIFAELEVQEAENGG